jgi:hypothetical protein
MNHGLTMDYTGPSEAEYESIGWPKTDAFVSDSRDIISTTSYKEQKTTNKMVTG